MIIVSPSGFSNISSNTTNATTMTPISIDIGAFPFMPNGGGAVTFPIIVKLDVTAIIKSGLSTNSAGVASLVRSFKVINSATASALTNLQVVGGLGGVVLLNVAPLIGDLAILGCTATLGLTGTVITVDITGLAGTSIDWSLAVSVITGNI